MMMEKQAQQSSVLLDVFSCASRNAQEVDRSDAGRFLSRWPTISWSSDLIAGGFGDIIYENSQSWLITKCQDGI